MNMYTYLTNILENGSLVGADVERTGTGTRAVFGAQMRFNLNDYFPLERFKKTNLNLVTSELFWMLRGLTDTQSLKDLGGVKSDGSTIWDEWANEEGDCPKIYGSRWRSWEKADGTEVDQIKRILKTLSEMPDDRGHVVSAWDPTVLEECALRSCHALFQFQPLPMQLHERLVWLYNRIIMLDAVLSKHGSTMQKQHNDILFNEYISLKEAMGVLKAHTVVRDIFESKMPKTETRFKNDLVMVEGKSRLRPSYLTRSAMLGNVFGVLSAEVKQSLSKGLDTAGVPRYALSCQLYQRSADSFLGLPFNIASYSTLAMMMARKLGMAYGDFIWTGGNCHVYANHIGSTEIWLDRMAKDMDSTILSKVSDTTLEHEPQLFFTNDPSTELWDYTIEDTLLLNYNPLPFIGADVAV